MTYLEFTNEELDNFVVVYEALLDDPECSEEEHFMAQGEYTLVRQEQDRRLSIEVMNEIDQDN